MLVVVYLAATASLLVVSSWRAPTAVIALHAVVLGALIAATWAPVVPSWLRAWAPLLALLFLYTEMPALIHAAGHAQLLDSVVMRWEQALFGYQPSIDWHRWWPSTILSEMLHAAYLSYYAIIFVVPLVLFFSERRAEFGEATFVLMLTFVACFVCYLIIPVAGPRYLSTPSATTLSSSMPIRRAVLWLLESRSSRGTAFPSSHVAVAVTQSILALRYFGSRGLVIAILTVGLAIGAVYGGFHYLLDVLAGAAVSTATTVAGLSVYRVLATPVKSQANASAPT